MQYVWNGEIRARERPDQNKRREKREKMRDVWIWTVIENNHFVLLSSSPSVCFIDGHCLNRYNWIMGTLGKAPSHPDRGEGAILQHSLNPAAVWDRSHQSYQLCEQWKKEEIFCLSHSQKHKRFVWGFVQTHIWHCYLRRGILLFYHLFSPKMRKIMCSVTKTKKKRKHTKLYIYWLCKQLGMKRIDWLQPSTAPHHDRGSQTIYRLVTSPANTPACNRLKRQRLNKHDSWKRNRILRGAGWMSCEGDGEAVSVILAEDSCACHQVQAASSTVPGCGSPGENQSSRDSLASLNC